MGTDPARALVVGDPALVDLVRSLLDETSALELDSARDVDAALERLRSHGAEVVLLDLATATQMDHEALSRLTCAAEPAELVCLSTAPALSASERVRDALEETTRILYAESLTPHLFSWGVRSSIERAVAKRERDGLRNSLDQTKANLARLAVTDTLSGVLNRAGLEQAFSRELDFLRTSGLPLTALIIDLDAFERINQALGRGAGDVVLREAVLRIKDSIRPTDPLGRAGGDQFLVLLPNTDPSGGRTVAERIRLALLGAPVELAEDRVQLSARLGLVAVPTSAISIDDVITAGRPLLRQDDRGRRNRVATAKRGSEAADHEGNPLAVAFEALARGDRFSAVSQPIIDLTTDRTVGYEILSRLGVAGFENPSVFFRLGFEAKILTRVDHGCLRICAAHTTTLDPEAEYHLNLLPSTLLSVPPKDILAALPASRARTRFCVELSEQQIIGDPSYLAPPIAELRAAGLRIAIDDVGFGRSCLENLVWLEPDCIKIDRRCISGVDLDADKRRILGRLCRVASALGSDVVAEGIETRGERAVLLDFGVRHGQGFLWGRPR